MSEGQRELLLPTSSESRKDESAPLYLGFSDRMNMEYLKGLLHNSPAQYLETPLNDLLAAPRPPTVTLDYVYFPLKLILTQKRVNKIVTQKIEDGIVSFALDFSTPGNKASITHISVGVKRTHETNNPLKAVGCVPIPGLEFSSIQDSKVFVKVDLDSVHTFGGKKIYDLSHSKEEDNLFHLVIDVDLANGSLITQNTRPFKLVERKISGVSKRTYVEANNTNSPDSMFGSYTNGAISIDSGIDSPHSLSSPSSLAHSPSTPGNDQGLIEARQLVADHIKTKILDLGDERIDIGKAISTPNGDIAYHFLLENDDELFEEGEVVGFVPHDCSEKKLVITKLTFKAASHAVLKGVITRSQYLEAQKPSPGVRSETIAMMGIIPVQVRGSVCTNEPLYASVHHPGFAVSGHYLESHQLSEAAFIGYAFSGRKAENEESAGMVQAAVSLLQSAGHKLLTQKLNKLEEDFGERIVKISRFGKQTRKCMCASAIIFSLLFILIAIFLWQLLLPGSAYRYYRCSSGRREPKGTSHFYMVPLATPDLYSRVNGIEFGFEKLMKKAGHNYHKLNGTGFRYYLNIDRCAYGYVTKGDIPRGIKPVRGPTVFAVDRKCFRSYYYNESGNDWVKYNSTSWLDYQNICCMPRSKWKGNSTKCLKET